MKKLILLIMMCISAALVAQTPNGVKVEDLKVEAGTVTFNVSWDRDKMPEVWVDSAWVFVDYNKNGVMERLQLSAGATLTATSAEGVGKVIPVDGNTQGVWVVGNAKTANSGSFSATVQLLTATTGVAGACAYASNYPPVGEYIEDAITFTGTAPYTVVLEDSGGKATTYTVDSPFQVPGGCTVKSFTDKTGAPGQLKCIPMTGTVDFSAPQTTAKSQPVSFTANGNLTVPLAATLSYTWSAPNFTPSSGTGTSYAPDAPANSGMYQVTLTAHSTGYCDLATSKTVTVIECNPSTVYTLEASASGFCAGDAGVTFSLSGTENERSYQLYKGDGIVATLTGTESAATFSGAQTEGIYTAKVLASGGECAATMNGAHTISRNALPEAPVISQPADVCQNAGSLVFTITAYSGTPTWTYNGGGTVNELSVTFDGSSTGTKTVKAQTSLTYTNAPTCYSEEMTQSASVLALPAMPVIAASASTVCLGTNIVFGVTEPASEATYTWAGIEGTASGTGDGTFTVSGATTGTKSVTAYASLATNGNTCQSGNSSLSAYVSQPGDDGQADDPTCGCAAGTTPCSGTCTTSGTYTKNDGACTGACHTAYVRSYDQCGRLLDDHYTTYPEDACATGCAPVYDDGCRSNVASFDMANNSQCPAECLWRATGWAFYAWARYSGGCSCYRCN